MDAFDLVLIVSDEHEGRRRHDSPAPDLEPNIDFCFAAQYLDKGSEKCRPLSMSVGPQLLAALDDVRIDANGGVVDKDAVVHASHIDPPDASFRDAVYCLVQVHRDLQNFREVIQRAERQHAERRGPAGEYRRDRVHGAVASAGDDGIGAGGKLAFDNAGKRVQRGEQMYARVHAGRLKQLCDTRRRLWFAGDSARRIQNDGEQIGVTLPVVLAAWVSSAGSRRTSGSVSRTIGGLIAHCAMTLDAKMRGAKFWRQRLRYEALASSI